MDKKLEASGIVEDASRRLEELINSLPSTTRGMFEFCIMLHLLEQAMPRFAQWARSEDFVLHLSIWASRGCPEVDQDEMKNIVNLVTEPQGKVN